MISARIEDVLDVVFNGVLSDAARSTSAYRVPSAMAGSAVREGLSEV